MRLPSPRVGSTTKRAARSESTTIAASYFWYFAGFGVFMPFTALYYRHLGFGGAQLGLLTAMPAIGIAISGPFWGILADTYGIHRQILRGVLIVAAIFALVLAQITTFLPFLIVLAVISLMMVPVPSLLDSYAVSAVERGGPPYGSLRIFGSAGYITAVIVMGFLLDSGVSVVIFYLYAGCHLLTCLVSWRLPPLGERVRRNLWSGFRHVLQVPSFLVILLTALLMTVCYSMLSMYLAVHIGALGGSTTIAGYAFAISALSEIPFVGFGARILNRFGARNVIIMSISMYIVRFALLGFVGSTAGVIAAQLMHGLSFGLFLIASVTLAHRLVGRDNAATAQALLATMGMGLGNIIGSMLGGVMIDITTTSVMYRWTMGVMILAFVVFTVGSRFAGRDAFEPTTHPI